MTRFFLGGREKRSRFFPFFLLALFFAGVLGVKAYGLEQELKARYAAQESVILYDRNGKEIAIKPNAKGYYARYSNEIPERFEELLLQKEDRFFYYHLGVNPVSIGREALRLLVFREQRGSSTLTQQLVKNLLGNENKRTLKNKLRELAYALSLEVFTSKEEILSMYANTAYFGNKAQGLLQASKTYFRASPQALSDDAFLSLLATLASPSQSYPGTYANKKRMTALARVFAVKLSGDTLPLPAQEASVRDPSFTAFEVSPFTQSCQTKCHLTIDGALTDTLRQILRRNLANPSFAGVNNGAIVAIKLPENELVALVGSPNPVSFESGHQINMAIKPRSIGSTVKPFIYVKAFEKGARPYTLVEDREYKYDIGTGFALYPKNYDGQFRGTVTLHQALSNSLNVPAVKVLEYLGLKDFSSFLVNDLAFSPLQPLEDYQLGIALGGLEMDLLTLSHYVTMFPNGGVLRPMKLFQGYGEYLTPPMEKKMEQERVVGKEPFVELINKILSDREESIDQFGMKSNLNLPFPNYALKTGTSRNFHDSWTLGYTPDFLVGVWIGNSDDAPMWQVSGQSGAGKIWQEAMQALYNSPYNKNTPFIFDRVKEFTQSASLEYGLEGDDYEAKRMLLRETGFMVNPHEGDVFLLEKGMRVPLQAKEEVAWYIDDAFIGKGIKKDWRPTRAGRFMIRGEDKQGKQEKVFVTIEDGE